MDIQPPVLTQKSEKKHAEALKAFTGLVVLGVVVWYFFGGGLEHHVASDVQKQYEIAVKNGNSMDAYVRAGLVAEAYLQADDEDNYRKWTAIQNEAGVRAGLGTPPAEEKHILSKQEWFKKAQTVQQLPMLVSSGRIMAGQKALYAAVGEPNSSEIGGENINLSWTCGDGTILINARNPGLTQGMIVGEISTY